MSKSVQLVRRVGGAVHVSTCHRASGGGNVAPWLWANGKTAGEIARTEWLGNTFCKVCDPISAIVNAGGKVG